MLADTSIASAAQDAAELAGCPRAVNGLSVVVPTLNDATHLRRLLPQLKRLRLPVVVSDGGSVDGSIEVALMSNARLVVGRPNRGEQLARGAAATTSQWLLFLHCDCELSLTALQQLAALVHRDEPAWGRFDIALVPQSVGVRCVAWFMNRRSRLTKVCTGDQGMFVHRDLLDKVGGVPCQPLMEDVELSKRLRFSGACFVGLPGPLQSSARRWHAGGVVRTILSMWRFRLRYWLGASPEALAGAYYSSSAEADPRSVGTET